MKHLVGRVLYGFDADVAAWVGERIPGFRQTAGAKALGVVLDGELAAGVVFEDWNGVHVVASIAAEQKPWAGRDVLRQLFAYPFVTLDCRAISVLVASSNLPSLNLAAKLGFKPEALVKYAATDGSDLIVMKMFREECRWIDHGEGKQPRAGATGPV